MIIKSACGRHTHMESKYKKKLRQAREDADQLRAQTMKMERENHPWRRVHFPVSQSFLDLESLVNS